MKIKAIIASFVLIVFGGLFVPKVLSQEVELSEFEKSYSEYKLKVEDYNKSHEAYVLARAQYLRFKTLKSQDDAQSATVSMLQTRDEVAISYMNALRKRLEEAEGVDESKRSELFIKIDEEIGWFTDHKNMIPSANSLEELVKDSGNAQKRYLGNTPLYYEILAYVSTGKLVRFQERFVKIFEGVGGKTGEIRSDLREGYQLSSRKLGLVDQWTFETQSRIDRSDQKLSEVDNTLINMSSNKKAGRKTYDGVISSLGAARQHLKEGSLFVKEILQEIMTKE